MVQEPNMLGSDRPRRAHLPPVLAVAFVVAASGLGPAHQAQSPTNDPPPSEFDPRVYDIVGAVSAERIEADIRTLVGFGTRHTLSETESETRGIGAARRWINAEFDRISDACGGCLEVSLQRHHVTGDPDTRIRVDTEVVNVLAVLRGSTDPNRYLIMSGDIDSRISDIFNSTDDSPGANDNASGMAGTIEAARVLSRHRFNATIVLVGLSGEEQGLIGGWRMAEAAKAAGWNIEGVLNNDMIGNIEGIDGVVENNTFRVFSEPTPVTETETQRLARRRLGGEVDGVSRQLARYVARIADRYIPNLDAVMVYRLDRVGRGGHHRPFNDLGFPGVRIIETHENYARQHQDVRVEDGIQYGDLLGGVNAEYAAKLTAVNAATLASLAWAPAPPANVAIAGAVRPSTTLFWDAVEAADLAGYKVWWRVTTAPQWEHSRFVGNVTEYTLENIIIDNYLFGVAAVDTNGNESVVSFPQRRARQP